MTDLITTEEAKKLLDGTTPGPWAADGDPWNRIIWSSAENRVCFMAHSNGLNDDQDMATSNLIAAAPDLARTVIALHAQLADAQARGMEMAIKTYRTGAGVDSGNYPLWAYDADYETAVRKKAEVHRKAASDRATRKDI